MGAVSSKQKGEIISLKAKLQEAEKEKVAALKRVNQKHAAALERERRKANEELAKVAALEEEKRVLELRNEILTELVATEQVNLKLQVRRSEALKFELLRHGVGGASPSQLQLDMSRDAPQLAATLSSGAGSPLPSATQDMSGAVEKMELIVRKFQKDLEAAFQGRDKGFTQRLSGVAFKDALKEAVPELISREDRQLLMLRFLREEDDTVNYVEFLEYFRRKAARRKLKAGVMTTIFARTTRSNSSSPTPHHSLGQSRGPFSIADLVKANGGGLNSPAAKASSPASKPSPAPSPLKGGVRFTGSGESSEVADGNSPRTPKLGADLSSLIAANADAFETRLTAGDAGANGKVPTTVFSSCLREVLGERVARSERKALYATVVVDGEVNYRELLAKLREQYGINAKPPLKSEVSSTRRTSKLKARAEAIESDELLASKALAALAEVHEDVGSAEFLRVFEEVDSSHTRTVFEEELIAVLHELAPHIDAKPASALYRAVSSAEGDGGVDYDDLIKELEDRNGGGEGCTTHAIEDPVEVLQLGTDGSQDIWTRGTITSSIGRGQSAIYSVTYDDGSIEEGLEGSSIRSLVAAPVLNTAPTASTSNGILGVFSCCMNGVAGSVVESQPAKDSKSSAGASEEKAVTSSSPLTESSRSSDEVEEMRSDGDNVSSQSESSDSRRKGKDSRKSVEKGGSKREEIPKESGLNRRQSLSQQPSSSRKPESKSDVTASPAVQQRSSKTQSKKSKPQVDSSQDSGSSSSEREASVEKSPFMTGNRRESSSAQRTAQQRKSGSSKDPVSESPTPSKSARSSQPRASVGGSERIKETTSDRRSSKNLGDGGPSTRRSSGSPVVHKQIAKSHLRIDLPSPSERSIQRRGSGA